MNDRAGHRWLMPIILTGQEAEIRRIMVKSQPRQTGLWDPIFFIYSFIHTCIHCLGHFHFVVVAVLGLELRAYTLSHSSSPFRVRYVQDRVSSTAKKIECRFPLAVIFYRGKEMPAPCIRRFMGAWENKGGVVSTLETMRIQQVKRFPPPWEAPWVETRVSTTAVAHALESPNSQARGSRISFQSGGSRAQVSALLHSVLRVC
jgi:hypothetical protein